MDNGRNLGQFVIMVVYITCECISPYNDTNDAFSLLNLCTCIPAYFDFSFNRYCRFTTAAHNERRKDSCLSLKYKHLAAENSSSPGVHLGQIWCFRSNSPSCCSMLKDIYVHCVKRKYVFQKHINICVGDIQYHAVNKRPKHNKLHVAQAWFLYYLH